MSRLRCCIILAGLIATAFSVQASPSTCASFALRELTDVALSGTIHYAAHAIVNISNAYSSINRKFGLAGGVTVAELGYIAVQQGFAGVSTDTGHSSGTDNGTWAGPHNDNAIIDFGWRALHRTVSAGKEVVRQYYGRPHKKAYYIGCSTGGRQGLKEVQDFPDDFDGVVVGSPANWMAHLQGWSIHMNLDCDALDGLSDGIINDPRICSFRPETLTCRPGQNASTCLTLPQIAALHRIYAPYYEADQTYIFDGYYPGGETKYYDGLVGEDQFTIGLDWFRYFVVNDTEWSIEDYNASVLQLAIDIDPGQATAINPNITGFAGPQHNGKLLQYVGWADQLISPGNPKYYYEMVHAWTQVNTKLNIDDFYRLFYVPGMNHCQGGYGANAFGGPEQASNGMPPLSFDPQHNILAAVVRWVEEGVAPASLTAAYYNGNNASNGVGFTRPLCKYPQRIQYHGGDPNVTETVLCWVTLVWRSGTWSAARLLPTVLGLMHRALQIRELLDIVIKYIRCGGDTRTVAALAVTCRAFHDAALDRLWWTLKGLEHLVMCLPSDAWEVSHDYLTITRELSASDWERFDYYASRVRVLAFTDKGDAFETDDTSSWYSQPRAKCWLDSFGPLFYDRSSPLLPNLRRLEWVDYELHWSPEFYEKLLVPTVASLILTAETYTLIKPADMSIWKSPQFLSLPLQELTLHLRERDNSLPLIRQALPHFRHLREFYLIGIPITVDALVELGHLPLLKFATLRLSAEDNFIPSLTATDALREASFSDYDAASPGELFQMLHDHCSHSSLRSISVERRFNAINPFGVVSIHALRPLFAFHQLTLFYISTREVFSLDRPSAQTSEPPYDLDDAAIWEMAMAWPALQSLNLGQEDWHHVSGISLRGLGHLAEKCPCLDTLYIAVDASRADDLPPELDGRCNKTIDTLYLLDSQPGDPPVVAAFLARIFPNLKRIDVMLFSKTPERQAWKETQRLLAVPSSLLNDGIREGVDVKAPLAGATLV
ncbi:putative feruloyl esterase B-1 [Grifola frondosa]|uniref:Carboxylic ester hydrolase n=1 Tax=Grifola frondosa TaxID=5627 RepID=A0A1C7M6N7_GRIFR|nr:putative feruloyl esterase B-1 [Grifola frondosa]